MRKDELKYAGSLAALVLGLTFPAAARAQDSLEKQVTLGAAAYETQLSDLSNRITDLRHGGKERKGGENGGVCDRNPSAIGCPKLSSSSDGVNEDPQVKAARAGKGKEHEGKGGDRWPLPSYPKLQASSQDGVNEGPQVKLARAGKGKEHEGKGGDRFPLPSYPNVKAASQDGVNEGPQVKLARCERGGGEHEGNGGDRWPKFPIAN